MATWQVSAMVDFRPVNPPQIVQGLPVPAFHLCSRTGHLWRRRRNRLGVKNGLEEVLDDHVLALLSRLLYIANLCFSPIVGLLLGLLVSLRMLSRGVSLPPRRSRVGGRMACTDLSLKRLVLSLLVSTVFLYLFLGFIASFLDPFGPVCRGALLV